MAGRQTNTPPGAPGSPRPGVTLAKLLGAMVVAGVLGAGVLMPFVGGIGLAAKHEADKFLNTRCTLQETAPPQKTEIYARDGKTLIATIFKQDRQPIPLSQVPSYLQDALIATEDRRFYSHHGVDMRGLIRSAVSTSGGDTQGGSTLTMQYVKQIRYYQAGDNAKAQEAAIAQNLSRKMEDAKCALYIEGTLHESKATILDNYLNIAFFGENSYGLETAAETYFGKPASKLTLPESALLVGLLRAPSAYDPFQYPEAAKMRRNQVLQNLVAVGDLSQAAADKEKATPITLATNGPPQVREGCINAPNTITNVGFFCDYTVHWLISHKVLTESQLQTGGYKIVTSLDAGIQNSAQAKLAAALPAKSPTTAVLPVLDPKTGDVLAMVTSKHYGNGKGETTLPIFTTPTAQGASTWKLFPLLTALSTGIPANWPLETGHTPTYQWHYCPDSGSVSNGDANETYNNNETLASATAKSANTYFVGLADQLLGCNLQPILTMATKLGMTQSLDAASGERGRTVQQAILDESRATQLVLGDIGTSPLEIAAAYSAVADEGRFHTPTPVLSITDQSGQPVALPPSTPTQAVAPQVADQAVQILTGDTTYPGTSASAFQQWYAVNNSPIAGKTGTSVAVNRHGQATNDNSSLWFVGLTPDLVGATALVNLDHPNYAVRGLPGISDPSQAYGAYAAGVWLDALEPTLRTRQWSWPDPNAVTGENVINITGDTLAQARASLRSQGLQMTQIDPAGQIECPSSRPTGQVAYYAPQIAPRGATITVCPSSGVQQDIYVPPPPPPPPPAPAPAPAPTHGGGNGGGGGGGAHGGGNGNGGGNGGGGGHHHPGGGTSSSSSSGGGGGGGSTSSSPAPAPSPTSASSSPTGH